MRRVVITGVGVITSLGTGGEKFWDSIKKGVCGIDKITRFDASEMNTQIAAEVKDFNPEDYIDKKEARRMDRYTQFAVSASKMAVKDANLDTESIDKDRFGVIIGSGIGGLQTLEDQHTVLVTKGPGRVSPFFIPMMIANLAAGQVSIALGAKGINETIVTACASGTNAIGDAFKIIQRDSADIIIAGGTEAPITPLATAGFCAMKATSTRNDEPKRASRPFDDERDGFVMGEGAGIVVLEELEHALKRGANIIAEVVGYGSTADAHHITTPAPSGEGAYRAMKIAIEDAGIKPEDLGYINAHGTSTEYNDKYETAAIKTLFGEYAYKLPISSTKSMTGHLLGAAGGVETIVCSYALREGYLPGTINYENQDPECDLNYLPNKGINKQIEYAMSNTFGFGGQNATVVLKKWSGK